jgi:hypothetical protein
MNCGDAPNAVADEASCIAITAALNAYAGITDLTCNSNYNDLVVAASTDSGNCAEVATGLDVLLAGICSVNSVVQSNVCEECPAGATAPGGEYFALAADSGPCTCPKDFRVASGVCAICGAGTENDAGDVPALGIDTECDGFADIGCPSANGGGQHLSFLAADNSLQDCEKVRDGLNNLAGTCAYIRLFRQ